jgi:hypothetical protein
MNINSNAEYKTNSSSYRALMGVFYRQKAKSPGVLASLYIDTFLLCSIKICADTVGPKGVGLCKENEFTAWRTEQRRLGNLDWDTRTISENRVLYEYKPGKKIMKNLEKVATEHGLMASKGYVDAKIEELRAELTEAKAELTETKAELIEAKADISDTKNQVSELQRQVRGIIEILDPPWSEEKEADLIEKTKSLPC